MQDLMSAKPTLTVCMFIKVSFEESAILELEMLWYSSNRIHYVSSPSISLRGIDWVSAF